MDAARSGFSRATLYEHVVRPALHGLVRSCRREGRAAEERLAVASVQAALVALAGEPRLTTAVAPRRRPALVSIGERPLEALDGQVIVDVLEADGWVVEEIAPSASPEEVAEITERDQIELVVLPTSNPEDLLLAAPTYQLLRRLADPPYIVACGLGSAEHSDRARAAGADCFAPDLDVLVSYVRSALPHRIARRWGLRIRRFPDALLLAPTGSLDDVSAERLRQVVASREGSYERLLIDLRDVADATADGVSDLVAWASAGGAALIGGPRVTAALDGATAQMRVFDDEADAFSYLDTA